MLRVCVLNSNLRFKQWFLKKINNLTSSIFIKIYCFKEVFMKIRVGVVGYGNLGHAMEREIVNNKRYDLVAIFSRRDVQSELGTPVVKFAEIEAYKDKIDVMIMCGGSKDDLMWQSVQVVKDFDIIDTFDTHKLIPKHSCNLNKLAKLHNHRAIYSCGWDPGIFSLYKLMGQEFLHGKTSVFWGKGVSQGHSDALRRIDGVADAIQYTIPNIDAIKQAKNLKSNIDENKKHTRLCYVALKDGASEEKITNEILNMPYYFKGQEVIIKFVSLSQIAKLKKKMYHAGKVISVDEDNMIKNEVSMKNNPQFTAKILHAYISALPKLESGAYSILQVPLSYISKNYDSYL